MVLIVKEAEIKIIGDGGGDGSRNEICNCYSVCYKHMDDRRANYHFSFEFWQLVLHTMAKPLIASLDETIFFQSMGFKYL